ncbi:MAG: hypothetical protein JWR07_1944 [Nevskia sp.]|nr:hypothetical protein [Nevskia sp.]
MSQPIVPLSEIIEDAGAAAKEMARTKVAAKCPYPPLSDVAARWHATLQRYLLEYSALPETEGSANWLPQVPTRQRVVA